MQKSIIVEKAHFTQKIVDAINTAELPAFVIRWVLDEVRATVLELEQAQYNAEMKAYQEEQKEAEDDHT